MHLPIEDRIAIRDQRPPPCLGLIPKLARRREGTPAHIVDGGIVHRHETIPRTGFDGHVAQRHARFHGERLHGRPRVLDGMASRPGRADGANDGQRQILGANASAQFALHLHPQVAALALRQALRRQHMLHLRRANALRQSSEGAVRRCMRIPAHDGHPRQRRPLFRADHVNDALAHIRHLDLANGEPLAVLVQRLHLRLGHRIGNPIDARGAIGGGHVVVRRRQIRIPPPRLPPSQGQPLERLRRRHFVQQMAVDVEQRHAVAALGHSMRIPNLVVDGAPSHRTASCPSSGHQAKPRSIASRAEAQPRERSSLPESPLLDGEVMPMQVVWHQERRSRQESADLATNVAASRCAKRPQVGLAQRGFWPRSRQRAGLELGQIIWLSADSGRDRAADDPSAPARSWLRRWALRGCRRRGRGGLWWLRSLPRHAHRCCGPAW